jgi:hypothetical protein
MTDTHPLTLVVEIPAAAVAQGATANTPATKVPFAATVTAVEYIAAAAITGAATNNRIVTLANKGAAGSGTTAVATKTFASGTNAVAAASTTVTLSATAADLVVAAGDVLQWQSTINGTGLADPGGLVRVTLSRNDS